MHLVTLAIALAACTPGATKGTLPPADISGEIDAASVPDFIVVWDNVGRMAGYVRKELVLGGIDGDWPVYASDLVSVVGHMVPNKGFVPLGIDSSTVPEMPIDAGSSPTQ